MGWLSSSRGTARATGNEPWRWLLTGWLLGCWTSSPIAHERKDARRPTTLVRRPRAWGVRAPRKGLEERGETRDTFFWFCGLASRPVVQLYTHSHEWTKASIFHADAAEQATPLHRLRRRRLTPGTQPGYDQSEEGEGGNEDAIPVHAELIVIIQARVPCSLRSPLHVWFVPTVGVHPETATTPRGGCAIIIVLAFYDGAAAPADCIIVRGSPLGVAQHAVRLGEVRKELLCFRRVVHIGVQAER